MRATFRDPELPHQIVFYLSGNDIGVSCNCLRGIDGTAGHHSPIEMRKRWTWPEARAAYVEYHRQERGVVPIGIGRMTH